MQQNSRPATILGEFVTITTADNPSVAPRQLPLHKGAKRNLNSTLSFHNCHSLHPGDPSVTADAVPASRCGSVTARL